MKNLYVVKFHQIFNVKKKIKLCKLCLEKNSQSNGNKIKIIEIITKKLSNF
jgi:hypothetical protein